jgi:hypothetical protein
MGCGFNFTRISSKTETLFTLFQILFWTAVTPLLYFMMGCGFDLTPENWT